MTAQRCLVLDKEAPKEPVPFPVREPRLLTEPLRTPCSLSAVEEPLVFCLGALGVVVAAGGVFLSLPLPMQMMIEAFLGVGVGVDVPCLCVRPVEERRRDAMWCRAVSTTTK